jgi:hypothetical protein
MRALILALVMGLMSLGSLALTPTNADAREWRTSADTVAVARWRGGSFYRWRGGSRYYYPGFRNWGGGYYAPSYGYSSYVYPSYDYYDPGFSYYYSPAYPSVVVPSYRYYYRPGVRGFVGW